MATITPDPDAWMGADYYTHTEAAAILRVSPRTLLRWAAEDVTLPMLRPRRGKCLFPARELRAWLARQQAADAARRIQKKGARHVRDVSAG